MPNAGKNRKLIMMGRRGNKGIFILLNYFL
jgi:hypothetical protein